MYSSFLHTTKRAYTAALIVLASAVHTGTTLAAGAKPRQENIKLLQPISGGNEIPLQDGLGTWITYFNTAGVWLYNIAFGICVVWVLIGGIQIMTSSDASDRRAQGFDKMKASIMGMVILTFSGLILRTLNNLFFT